MNNNLSPILAMLICFIIGSFSIYEIISMATPINIGKEMSKSINNEPIKHIDSLIQNPAPLAYNPTNLYLSKHVNIYQNQSTTKKISHH